MERDTGTDDFIRQQFTTTYDALKTFFEWRHNVLTRFMIVVGAVLAAWQWLGHQTEGLRVVVLLASAVFSATTALSDRVNAGHIRKLYRLGARIEDRAGGAERGVFETIEGKGRILTYGRILAAVYWGATALFLVFAMFTASASALPAPSSSTSVPTQSIYP